MFPDNQPLPTMNFDVDIPEISDEEFSDNLAQEEIDNVFFLAIFFRFGFCKIFGFFFVLNHSLSLLVGNANISIE